MSSKKQKQVWKHLEKNPTDTAAQVSKATGISYGYAYKLMRKEEAKDIVKKPQPTNQKQVGGQHYVGLSVEPWASMETWMTKQEFIGFLKGGIFLALGEKNANDLGRAGNYMQKLLEIK
jgi:hypothetical protein|tara:strand:- start:398 stop:754 length:357 start_codon:yes stop_codon:yes gene_type:complete